MEQNLARYRELAEVRRAAIYEDFFSPVTNRLARRLLERLPRTPTGLAIDLGCGPGMLLDDLRKLGWRALGVDLEEAMLRRARVRDAGAALVAADAAALPFADGTADLMVLAFVVPHVSDLSAVLRETRRILCPGGRLACVTWHASGRSPLTGLAFDVMRRQAWLSDEEQAFLEDIDSRASQLPDVATAAGLSPLLVEDLHDERRLPDADEWWNGITGSSVGLGRLLDPRPPAERRRLRESFHAAAEVFRASDGLRIPVAARILVANKR